MVVSALETSLFQAQRAQTVLRKRYKGKERLLGYDCELVSLVSHCKLMHIKYSRFVSNTLRRRKYRSGLLMHQSTYVVRSVEQWY